MKSKVFPQPVVWLMFAAIMTGTLSLLLGLPTPYSSVVLLVMLFASGLLTLHIRGYSPQDIIAQLSRRLWPFLNRVVITPARQIIHALIRFYQRDTTLTQPDTAVHPFQVLPFVSWTLSLAVTGGLVLAVVMVFEAPFVGLFIGLLSAATGGVAAYLRADVLAVPRLAGRFIRDTFTQDHVQLVTIPRLQIAAELLLVLALTLVVTKRFYTAGPLIQLSGGEAEWITNSVYAAHNGLRDYGRIPLWQPLLEFGEPLIDNPVGFVLNPFSSLTSLILGGAQGMKYAVVLNVMLAGLGGWFLGWILGLSWAGRVLLGMLLVGKGNMSAMFNTGYFQLAAQQAYFPWIAGGLMAIYRLPGRRWPVVLTGLAFTLLFFAGNLWYVLPMLFMLALLTVMYVFKPSVHAGLGRFRFGINWAFLRGVVLAGLVTVGLSAVLLLPLAVNWERLDKHPPEVLAGWQVSLFSHIVPLYVNPDPNLLLGIYDPKRDSARYFMMSELEEIYYSFVLPLWFVALIFVALPLYRPRYAQARRFWLAAWIMVIFCTLWAAGGHPLFLWLYEKFEFMRGWRYVGRALGVGAFFLAVLVAMRVDVLWRILRETNWREYFHPGSRLARTLPAVLIIMLLLGSGYAAWQVGSYWNIGNQNVLNTIHLDDACVSWLRERNPDKEISIWRGGYRAITTYLNHQARAAEIYADFEMSPLPSTVGPMDLTLSLPEYGMAWSDKERSFLYAYGYRPILDSPSTVQGKKVPCLFQRESFLSYAYTVPFSVLLTTNPDQPAAKGRFLPRSRPIPQDIVALPHDKTTPITTYIRQPDNILLLAQGYPGRLTIVTVQERAYPGWEVTVNGQPAKLESVGGQIGVLLPDDGGQYVVYFAYRPPLLFQGAAVTIVCAAFCTVYLLRAERLLRRRKPSRK